jgi:membrane associated rhomboid family serine protease
MRKSSRFYNSLHYPLTMVIILWGILAIDYIFPFNLYVFGIYPRALNGIWGIFSAPFIHGGVGHLLSNSPPLFVLMALIIYFYQRIAFSAISLIWILTGLAVWLFGREVYHIGASGVVYGLVAFVFWSGIFRRSVQAIILSLIVIFLYSGMFIGILPDQPGISWESHLFGAVVGILVAYWFRKEIIHHDDEEKPPEQEEDDTPPRYLLDDDAFGHRFKRNPYDTDYEDLGNSEEKRPEIW